MFSIVPVHLPGCENQVADMISRLNMGDNFQINPDLFTIFQNMSNGALTIDRFATQANAILQNFNSLFYESSCSGIDAFAQENYLEHGNFCNPPYAVLGKLYKFITSTFPEAKYVLVFPQWTAQSWFANLLKLTTITLLLPDDLPVYVKINNLPG
jgi:hypothetical protein